MYSNHVNILSYRIYYFYQSKFFNIIYLPLLCEKIAFFEEFLIIIAYYVIGNNGVLLDETLFLSRSPSIPYLAILKDHLVLLL
jgi:hypothetical protein